MYLRRVSEGIIIWEECLRRICLLLYTYSPIHDTLQIQYTCGYTSAHTTIFTQRQYIAQFINIHSQSHYRKHTYSCAYSHTHVYTHIDDHSQTTIYTQSLIESHSHTELESEPEFTTRLSESNQPQLSQVWRNWGTLPMQMSYQLGAPREKGYLCTHAHVSAPTPGLLTT